MNSILQNILLLLTAFIGGFVLMSMELVYPRISVIWFGNILTVWAIDLSMSLIVISIGYWVGSWLLVQKKHPVRFYLISIYLIVAMFLSLINMTHHIILEKVSTLDVISGSVLFSILFMFPTMGLLAITGPLLVHLKSSITSQKAFSSSLIFGVSTMGGAIAMLVVGLYFLPYHGINYTVNFLIAILLANAILMSRINLKYQSI